MQKHKKKARSRQKELYRVRNWSEYDRALVQRGSLTIWISEDAMAKWKHSGPKQRGAQKEYSDLAIEIALTLKEVFHLTNRGTEGMIGSIFRLMGVGLSVPDHTTLSRRGKSLAVRLPKRKKVVDHLVVDSTGLKLYGEGEWKMRKHGKSKRRVWRKIHLSVDSESGEIQAGALSEAGVSDAKVLTTMLEEIDQQIENFSAHLNFSGENGQISQVLIIASIPDKIDSSFPGRESNRSNIINSIILSLYTSNHEFETPAHCC